MQDRLSPLFAMQPARRVFGRLYAGENQVAAAPAPAGFTMRITLARETS